MYLMASVVILVLVVFLCRGIIANLHITKMQLLCFVSDNVALSSLSKKAASRTHAAFRPKTRQA